MKVMNVCEYVAPCGRLALGEIDGRLVMCDWLLEPRHSRIVLSYRCGIRYGDSALLALAGKELDEYFAGSRREFTLQLAPEGTAFRRSVWEALAGVEYGATLTYGALASRLGRPSAVRAVASAVGANPLSLFVPCHRIVAAGGLPGGYAGGLEAKRYLLELESGRMSR
ncbi:MAG: methylated-DNA--[protein]-cysteine S-methyltransferase [Muribaculaceae bacterium]|nr:methylated-DNA--[protein]-cysteine S-methyltransferase [Muribaculaceae bacterium]